MQVNALLGQLERVKLDGVPNQMAWVQSFDLVYGTKHPDKNPHKVALVDGDREHYCLRVIENQERESRDFNGSVPNYVVASISFVVSDRGHIKGGPHGRKVVTIPIKFKEQAVSHVTSVYTFDDTVQQKRTYKRSAQFKEDLLADSPAEKAERINTYYNKATNTFSDTYHHSERALWRALREPEMVQKIVAELFKKTHPLGVDVTAHKVKVYSAIIDLHSTRYLCSECEPSCFLFQKKLGKFSEGLQGVLRQQFMVSQQHGLTLATRVSCEDKGKRSLKLLQDHVAFWPNRDVRVLRSSPVSLILQRDDRTAGADVERGGQYGLFVSSQKVNTPQPVYIAKRRDAPYTALELTDTHKQFMQNIAENRQYVKDLLAQARATQNLAFIEKAYGVSPDDLNVWIEHYNIVKGKQESVEAFRLSVTIFKRLAREYGPDHYHTKQWAEQLNNCFLVVYEAELVDWVATDTQFIELNDSDPFQLYLLRALYYANTGDKQAAIQDLKKAHSAISCLHKEYSEYITGLLGIL